MNPLERFTIGSISKRLNKIDLEVSLSHQNPFPNLHLLSQYQFSKRFVEIRSDGTVQGGLTKMIISLVDFSFIRSLVAHRYSVISPPCYDPVSLFLIDLFRYMDGYQHSSQILSIIHDEERGRAYRAYAGISMKHLPCEGTLSNFRARIGENLYNEIFHILVGIFHKLEMITFKVLAHDGTLFPTWARYKGCTYFCEQCCAITVEDVLDRVRNRVLYRLNRQSENPLGSECRVYSECPSTRFPEEVQRFFRFLRT
jgi:hypothetical protein